MLSVKAFLTVVLVWEHLSMIRPPIQLPVIAWKDAMEMAVLQSAQAFLTVVLVWEHLSIILLLIQLHVTVWKDAMVMTVLWFVQTTALERELATMIQALIQLSVIA